MKKLLSIILCLVLALSLVACGSDIPQDNPVSSSSSGEQVASTPQVWYSKDGVELSKADLDRAISQEYIKPKNVIIMIGDGMGLNDIKLTNKFSDFLFEFGVSFEHLPNVGEVTTNSWTGVTDSAAAATALSSGEKTKNGRIGLGVKANITKNVSELAREYGKKVGIVTNDSIYGATPAGFTVHTVSRENTDKICQQFLEFAPDVLIGGGHSTFIQNINASETHKALLGNINLAPSQSLWETQLNADPNGEKAFFGFLSANHDVTSYQLAQATELALKRLENEKGFFLMVESAAPDSAGHGNVIERKHKGVASFDKAVAVAIKYCLNNPDTVLIVTADHETGGVTLPEGEYELSKDLFTTTSHTGVNVGVFALGYGTEYFKGKTVDNTDIAKFMHAAIKGETYK